MKTERVVIDVLAEDSFRREHVPGAVNLCVYETAFPDKVREAFPDQATALTVCGWSDETLEAREAAAKLQAIGYRNVEVLPGGLNGWKNQGQPIEGAGDEVGGFTGRLELDPAASGISWTGRNLFNFHTGRVGVAQGWVEFRHGQLKRGECEVDLRSILCTDLTDVGMHQMLIAHLASDDFFSIDKYPTAKFVLTSAAEIPAATPGRPNVRLHGTLTLRGVTHDLACEALVARRDDGGYVAQALLDLDRTVWGSHYGSGRFFARLGQHVVNDLVHLHLKLVTR